MNSSDEVINKTLSNSDIAATKDHGDLTSEGLESLISELNQLDKAVRSTTPEDPDEADEAPKPVKKNKRGRKKAVHLAIPSSDGAIYFNDGGALNCIPVPGAVTTSRQENNAQLFNQPQFQPIVLLQRVTPAYIAKCRRKPGRPRKTGIAKKHTRSFVPNLREGDPLKLTLKLVSDTTVDRSFEVVSGNKILIGPGETFHLNGSVFNEVKQEVPDKEEDLQLSVEGSVDKLGEEGEGEGTDVGRESEIESSKEPEEPDGKPESLVGQIDDGCGDEEREHSQPEDEEELDEEEEEEEEEEPEEEEEEGEGSAPVTGNLNNSDEDIDIKDNVFEESSGAVSDKDSLEEVCRETINDLKRLEEAADSDSEDDDDFPASPTPSEQLQPDFLAPACSPTPSELPPGSPMVEHNSNSNSDAPATSPAYPSTSPAPPSQKEPSSNEETEHTGNKDSSKPAGEGPSFQWGNSEVNDSVVSPPVEERDPLLLTDPSANGTGTETNANSALLNSTNESLLRGFLSDSADKGASNQVTLSGNDGLLALGSEYMSLERLGERALRCDVCGERYNDQEELNDHRSRAGHYKCGRPECGGQVFKTSDDLATHTRVTHSSQFPRPPLVMINQSLQSPPVQQLAQQVQRLPMPQPYLNQALNSHPPMVQIHQMVPQPGTGFQDAARRPPPLYRVPAPTNMAPPQHITPQYANTQQQMMSQMYGQQYRHPQPGGFLQQLQPNQQMQQQPRPNFIQQMQQPRGQLQQQQRMPSPQSRQQGPQIRAKRMATGPPLGTSPNAKRRMDMLIPDRHDNADCHVIAMQKRTDSGPLINSVEGAKSSGGRADSLIHLTDSITLSRQSNPALTATPIGGSKNKSDAKAVANVLASRGITVTPAGGGNARSSPNQRQSMPRPVQAPAPTPVTTLNLNSAISIIPTGNSQNSSGFAVPQNRAVNRQQSQTSVVERPPRPPTVDLTGDSPMMGHSRSSHGNMRGRMRGRPPGSGTSRNQCQICDKAFSTEESLAQHMQLHRSPGKLPYRCNLCPAQYPTQQGLLQHRQVYHKEPATGSELALPVVDMKQPGTLSRLANMGIQHFLPLSQLSSQQGGYFGLPIVSIDGARNPAVCNLGALGASNILSLGPMKPLPR